MSQPLFSRFAHPYGYKPATQQSPPGQGTVTVGQTSPPVGYVGPLGTVGIQVGAFLDDLATEIEGAVGAAKPGVPFDPRILNAMRQRLVSAQQQVQTQAPEMLPFVQPAARAIIAATKLTDVAQQAAVAERVRYTAARLRQPITAIPICIDALGSATETAAIEISAPYNGQAWQHVAMQASPAGTVSSSAPMRLTEYNVAGINLVTTSNVTGITPTSPGWDLGLWASTNFLHGSLPEHRLAPWTYRKDMVLDPSAKIRMKVYNPHTAAQTCNITLLIISSPCAEGYEVGKEGFLPFAQARKFIDAVRRGSLGKLFASFSPS